MPQVAAAIAQDAGNGRIQVQLDPPELGRIDIGLDVSEQGVRANLVADRQATGDMLRRHADMLAQNLAEAGFENIDLSFGDGQDDFGKSPEPAWSGARDTSPVETTGEDPAPPSQLSSAGLDLRL